MPVQVNMPAVVMGIDPSLTACGIVVLDQEGKGLKSCTLSSKNKDISRIIDIDSQLYDLLDAFQPWLVVLEGYAFGIGKGSALASLGELGGVVKKTLSVENIPYIIVPPTSVKKFATGKGNSKKDEMRLSVFKRWGWEAKTTDEVDAYVLARMGLAALGFAKDLTKAQQEALAKVEGIKELLVPA